MLKFDWVKFCTQYKIPFVTSGPNVARKNIGIQCPWCGDADPSHHLGLSKESTSWGCFRNPGHRGRNPRRLVQRLLHCSYQQAVSIVSSYNIAVPDDFDTIFVKPELNKHEQDEKDSPLIFPKAFHPFTPPIISRYEDQFLRYLAKRGFGEDVYEVCKRYSLRYALTGDYAWRLLFPVYDTEGCLRNWSGRVIRDGILGPRYKNATNSRKDLLYNENLVVKEKPGTIFVVEGPLDCVKIDYYGQKYGCGAVATLGTSITPEQVARVALLGNKVKHLVLLMDPEAFNINTMVEGMLAGVTTAKVLLGSIPDDVEDPGALTQNQVEFLCNKYLERAP